MNIAFGHTNTDFDCFGSLILVKKLFPDYRLVKSSRIHPAAQNMYDYYTEYYDFLSPKDIITEKIENIIIVDTCMAERVKEYFHYIKNSNPSIKIFDHHHIDCCDIHGAVVEGGNYGANTSLLGKMAIQKGIVLDPVEATIALTAIYADTGKLIFENVSRVDYEVSAWLLDMGASLRLVKSFLEPVKEDAQIAVLNQIHHEQVAVQGHQVLLSYMELEANVAGLAAVVEKIMDVQNPDAYFAVFFIPKEKTTLIIARSQKKKIALDALLSVYGGGGHQLAASAKITGKEGREVFDSLIKFLDNALEPAARAKDIMSKNVITANDTATLMEVSISMEKENCTAMPVVDRDGLVCGFISLRDIMKGRKHGKMQAPVKAYMSRPVISASADDTIRVIERMFYKHKISCLPILDNGKLIGMVTRWDYLQFQKNSFDESGN